MSDTRIDRDHQIQQIQQCGRISEIAKIVAADCDAADIA
jgi:hypothetical protein